MYLSIVCVSRNDNYGGNGLNRFEYFISSIDFCLKKLNISRDVELVLVDWNPPEDKEDFNSIIDKLDKKYNFLFEYTIKTISREYHQGLNIKIPIVEFEGKNVGLSLAKGEYILLTNPDIVFQVEFFKNILNKSFDKNYFYRSMRIDVDNKDIYTEKLEYDKLINYCENNIILYNTAYTSCKKFDKSKFENEKKTCTLNSDLYTNASGDFTLAHRDVLYKIKGYYETKDTFTSLDTILIYQLYLSGIKQKILDFDSSIYHIEHDRIDKGLLIYGNNCRLIINELKRLKKNKIMCPLEKIINSKYIK